MAMHMLYHVPEIGAAVRELRRIVQPSGTVLVSTNSASTLAEIHEVLNAAVSARLGTTIAPMPALSFTTQTGGAALGAVFSQVTLHGQDVTLSFPDAEPVVRYLASVREPIIANVEELLDFDAALADVAARVNHVIRTQGRFRTTFRNGVFVVH